LFALVQSTYIVFPTRPDKSLEVFGATFGAGFSTANENN
jgi:hypothetical protein